MRSRITGITRLAAVFALMTGIVFGAEQSAPDDSHNAEMIKMLQMAGVCHPNAECVPSPDVVKVFQAAKATEQWEPVPPKMMPSATGGMPPSDAIILFDGKDLHAWIDAKDHTPARWPVHDGIVTVDKTLGNIETKQHFRNYQLHMEWLIPKDITGEGQFRGNSGLFLASTGPNDAGYEDAGYEIQILDSWNNPTYVNGQAASIYKQAAPLVNASREPGAWQSYDVIWTAPTFNSDGTLKSPAYVTLLHNGVLVQNHAQLAGETRFVGRPTYRAYDRAAVKLQAHRDPSAPISFRNIWLRELDGKN
jgi:hypothetical protein